jgi:hypothetical protein
MVKAEKGGWLYGLGHAIGRGIVSTQLILSHLWGIDRSYRFKQTKELGTGDKGTHKQCQTQVWSGWPLSQSGEFRIPGRSSGVVIWTDCQLADGPSWGRSTVRCAMKMLSSVFPVLSWFQGGCKVTAKRMAQSKDKNGGQMPCFSLAIG